MEAIDSAVPQAVDLDLVPDTSPLVNREELLLRLNGDLDLLRLVVSSFLADAPQSLDAIRAAVESNNAESLHLLAHSLKGAVSTFSAEDVNRVALRLETMAHQRDLSHAREAYSELERMMARLTPELAQLANL